MTYIRYVSMTVTLSRISGIRNFSVVHRLQDTFSSHHLKDTVPSLSRLAQRLGLVVSTYETRFITSLPCRVRSDAYHRGSFFHHLMTRERERERVVRWIILTDRGNGILYAVPTIVQKTGNTHTKSLSTVSWCVSLFFVFFKPDREWMAIFSRDRCTLMIFDSMMNYEDGHNRERLIRESLGSTISEGQ